MKETKNVSDFPDISQKQRKMKEIAQLMRYIKISVINKNYEGLFFYNGPAK